MSSLNDPEAVLFEPFVEDDDPSGMTEDEAYAFLAGADTATSTLPPITAAFWNQKDHPRDRRDGQFIDKIGGSAAADFVKKFTVAARGSKDVRKAAPIDIGGHGPRSTAPDTRFDQAIDTYMSGAYKQINEGLRSNGGKADKLTGAPGASPTAVNGTQAVRDAVAKIDQAMAESKLRHDVVVHRGVTDPHIVFGDHWSDDVTGLSWLDHGFGSSTPDESYARSYAGSNGVILNILVPSGTSAVYVEETLGGGETTHNELVLNRGLRYRVVHDHGSVKGRRTLDVEVIP